ncbi:MAG: GNAT family N-acetyltransferase [Burkholderiales bacterium]
MELIRPERDEDAAAVRRVHEIAFPTAAEANLVDRLRAGGKSVIALVAEDGDSVVGHILFSPVALEPLAGAVGLGLAPVAVLPDHEKHGVGRRLIQNGLAECRAWGAGFVVVIGDPPYYGRFGFEPAEKYGLRNEFGAGEGFMVFELVSGGLPPSGTLVKYAPEFTGMTKPAGRRKKNEGKNR